MWTLFALIPISVTQEVDQETVVSSVGLFVHILQNQRKIYKKEFHLTLKCRSLYEYMLKNYSIMQKFWADLNEIWYLLILVLELKIYRYEMSNIN